MNTEAILDKLEELFPDAGCELMYKDPFQLAVAVILAAQATDAGVNKVTPALFEKYEDAQAFRDADLKELEDSVKSIGLYRNKAANIKKMATEVCERHQGKLPSDYDSLIALSGIGRKSANVILSECFKVQRIAVDTHVQRVSGRLGLREESDDVLKCEEKLMAQIPENRWSRAHHLLLFFGRYLCTAKRPQCERCPFTDICVEKKKEKS